ncbi:MAG TPA: hypothetical protein VFG76_06445, partial [Candidatus Polarisedimenticolia bacterium]|nr:hypothetical protein [Candidatus Polarisedimenticolia bacterium]
MQAPETASAGANPLVAAILEGRAPASLKISASRGVLPLPRPDLIRILIALREDPDPEIRRESSGSLTSIPEEEILSILADPSTSAQVLDHFGSDRDSSEGRRLAVLVNPATPDSTLRLMAPSLTTSQIDQLLLNQTRLIGTPDLLDLLEGNPSLAPLQRVRIDEIRLHYLSVPAARPAPLSDPAPPAPALEPEPEPEEAFVAPADGGQTAEAEERSGAMSTHLKILRMNTAEKVQLALKGSREDRTILIKDASKLVQEAVLESPKLTENEIEAIARMRSVTEDVLRIIAGSREFMKNYAVVLSL